MKRKALAFVLTLAMLLTVIPASAFAGTLGPTYNYVAIGSGITQGFGLSNDSVAYTTQVAAFIGEATGTTVVPKVLGENGMRPEEVRIILDGADGNYNGDSYTANHFNVGALRGKQTTWTNAIKDADYITVELGRDSVLSYIYQSVVDNRFDDPLDDPDDRNLVEVATEILEALGLEEIGQLMKAVPYAYTSFCRNFDYVISKINDINPVAKIVVLGIPEYEDGIDLVIGDKTVDITELLNSVVSAANAYMKNLSKQRTKYQYVSLNFTSGLNTNLDTLKAEDGVVEASEVSKYIECIDADRNLGPVYNELENITIVEDLGKTALSTILSVMSKAVVATSTDVISLKDLREKDTADALKSQLADVSAHVTKVTADTLYTSLAALDLVAPLAFYTRTSIGDAYFTYPNAAGHTQIANAVIGVLGAIGTDTEMQERAQREKVAEIKDEIETAKEAAHNAIADRIEKTAKKISDYVQVKVEIKQEACTKLGEIIDHVEEGVTNVKNDIKTGLDVPGQIIRDVVDTKRNVATTILQGIGNIVSKIGSLFGHN